MFSINCKQKSFLKDVIISAEGVFGTQYQKLELRLKSGAYVKILNSC